MRPERFEEIVDEVFDKCRSMLIDKAKMYAHGGDRLSNFKRASEFTGLPPAHTLLGFATKQVVSIYDYTDDTAYDIKHTREQWLEKMVDTINYLGPLLLALLEDEREIDFEYPKVSL